MNRDVLLLAYMDVRLMFRSKITWLWAFVMPVLFFYFIGTVTGGGRRAAQQETIAVHAPDGAGFLAEHLVRRLEERGYRVIRVPSERDLVAFRRRLRVPQRFSEEVLAGRQTVVKLEGSGGGLDASYDEFRVSRAVYTVLADIVALAKGGGEVSPGRLNELARQPRNVTLAVESAGVRLTPPSGFQQSVPGNLVMFIMLVMFTSGSVTLTIERNNGILRRLASAPVSRYAVVAGKLGARMALGVVQIAFAMIVGTVLFRVEWGPHLLSVVILLLTYAVLAATAGMLLGNFATSDGQAIGIGVVTTNVLAALGGCWWPIEITPSWVQKLSLLLPTGWTMDALHKLMSFGAAPPEILLHLAALGLLAAAGAWSLARKFRFQ
jgi:ABC-type Na+ efflux pump permease subunit